MGLGLSTLPNTPCQCQECGVVPISCVTTGPRPKIHVGAVDDPSYEVARTAHISPARGLLSDSDACPVLSCSDEELLMYGRNRGSEGNKACGLLRALHREYVF